ncbi:hypothetical protein Q0F99_15080 [Rathayibacter oskolensis]|uniref:HNH endonuclease signature motif containing protein n=1 Tax=Rathayibacter oskolensis TaxID=1891671 RepID=UPI00265E113F|nr:hypothetical protein [Rathayibacter oskolensis]WKK70996.1 hypothetical protein Q0F99_15080 [Rathayibacter oskolensis]
MNGLSPSCARTPSPISSATETSPAPPHQQPAGHPLRRSSPESAPKCAWRSPRAPPPEQTTLPPTSTATGDPATIARELAGVAATFTRVLTDPHTGTVVSVGRTHRVPPPQMRLALQLRDQTCRFPGCTRPASTSEADHTIEWRERRPHLPRDLASLCTAHHHVRHGDRWTYRLHPDGTTEWTTPTGRHVTTSPTRPPPDDQPPHLRASPTTRPRSGAPPLPGPPAGRRPDRVRTRVGLGTPPAGLLDQRHLAVHSA